MHRKNCSQCNDLEDSQDVSMSRLQILWKEWILPVGIILLLTCSFRSAVADWNDVPTGSMKPTILEGDRIFVNKLAYDMKIPFTTHRLMTWDHPERGDIVVCFSPADGIRLVKRVIGLPGDRIAMSGNRMLINGETISYEPIREEVAEQIRNYIPLEADYAEENLEGRQHSIMLLRGRAFPSGFSSVTVPESQYFVMGDNRRNSKDSRVFGFVDRGEILGEATTVVLSLDYKKYFKPRWNRFFLKLR